MYKETIYIRLSVQLMLQEKFPHPPPYSQTEIEIWLNLSATEAMAAQKKAETGAASHKLQSPSKKFEAPGNTGARGSGQGADHKLSNNSSFIFGWMKRSAMKEMINGF